jgi:predicted ATPase
MKAAKNVAEFTFAELCDDARAGPDYQAICDRFNCVILRKIPVLDMKRRDRMRRFILLIDILYYNHIDVYIEADVPVEEIFNIKDSDIIVESNTEIWERQLGLDANRPDFTTKKEHVHDEEFAYERTLSRLHEMQT